MFTNDNLEIITKVFCVKMSDKKGDITFISTIWTTIFFKSWELYLPFIVSKPVDSWIPNK